MKSQTVVPLRSLSRKQQEESLEMTRGCAYTRQPGATEQLEFALRPRNSQGVSDLDTLLNILCPFTILCTSKCLQELQECSAFSWNWLVGLDFWVPGLGEPPAFRRCCPRDSDIMTKLGSVRGPKPELALEESQHRIVSFYITTIPKSSCPLPFILSFSFTTLE